MGEEVRLRALRSRNRRRDALSRSGSPRIDPSLRVLEKDIRELSVSPASFIGDPPWSWRNDWARGANLGPDIPELGFEEEEAGGGGGPMSSREMRFSVSR